MWQKFQKELGRYQKEVDTANASGEHLISDILDDPTVTKQDLEELNEAWENTRQLSLKKQERMNEALKDAKKFEGGLNNLVMWIDAQNTKLQSQLPPDEDASILQQQIEEHKVNKKIAPSAEYIQPSVWSDIYWNFIQAIIQIDTSLKPGSPPPYTNLNAKNCLHTEGENLVCLIIHFAIIW